MKNSMRQSFTIVETILVVALLGVMLFLAAPSLGVARDRARTAVNLSNLRQHATVMRAYAGDYSGLFPQLADPVATYSVMRCESAGIALAMPYFQQTRYWNIGLADGYYGGAWSARFFQSPWLKGRSFTTSYELACTMVADPRYYNYDTRLDLPTQLRGVRSDEVLFPSKKSVLVASESVDVMRPTAWEYSARRRASSDVGFVDGHAASPRPEQIGAQLHNGDGPFAIVPYGGHLGVLGLPMTHTVDGVRGRDVR